MNVIKTDIEGVVIIEPRIFGDPRGYFFESFSQRDFDAQVRTVRFVQDNESRSCYGVLRGLHFQKPPFTQSKLVRVHWHGTTRIWGLTGGSRRAVSSCRRRTGTTGGWGILTSCSTTIRTITKTKRYEHTGNRGERPVGP